MAKNSVTDWDTTAGNNSDVGGINIAEGCAAANMNNAVREIMAQVADSVLPTFDGLAKTDGNIIVSDGASWVVESGSTARTSLGAAGLSDANTFTENQTVQKSSGDVEVTAKTTGTGDADARFIVDANDTGESEVVFRNNGTDIGSISIDPSTNQMNVNALGTTTAIDFQIGGNQVARVEAGTVTVTNTATGDADAKLVIDAGDTGESEVIFQNDAVEIGSISFDATSGQMNLNVLGASDTIDFQVNGSLAARVNSDGLVADNSPVAHGYVTNSGSPSIINDFGIDSVSLVSTGRVRVTLDSSAGGSSFTVIAVPASSSASTISVAPQSSTTFDIFSFVSSTGAAVNIPFSFVVYPDL